LSPASQALKALALTAIVVLVLCFGTPAVAAPKVEPLTAEAAKVLGAIPHDPAPPDVIQQTHYFISNEHHPERFRKALKDVGGIYVGVGAEQNYLFAGWAKPKIILLVDFDQMIVDVHAVYRELLLRSADAEAFIARWSPKQLQSTTQLLSQAFPDAAERKRVLQAFVRSRAAIHPRLKLIRMRFGNNGIPTFLTEPELYTYLVEMERAGRVRAIRGDFTAKGALRGVAKAAQKLKLPVRAMYLSNVEFYFNYDTGLGDNLARQPADARSVTLRTVPFKHRDSDYRYVVQKTQDFHAWLKQGQVASFQELLLRESGQLVDEVWYVPGPP